MRPDRLISFAFGWVLVFLFTLSVTPINAEKPSASTVMAQLVEIMRDRNVTGLLELLPITGVLIYTNTIDKPYLSTRYTPSALHLDIETRTGFYEVLFGFRGDDSWRDVFEQTNFMPWVERSSSVFWPPGQNYANGRHFVRWRYEGSRWVIAEIGAPDS